MTKSLLVVILTGLILVSVLVSAEAYSVTFNFTGQITTGGGGSNPWSNYDSFYGSYTFEDNTVGRVGYNDYTYYDAAITEWDVTFPTFSIGGNVGHISVSDNEAFGNVLMDRYLALSYVSDSELPIGFSLI